MNSKIFAGLAFATVVGAAAPAMAQTVFPNPVPFVAGTALGIATAPLTILGAPFEGRSAYRNRPGFALSDTPYAASDRLNQSPSPFHPEGPDDDADIGG